MKAPTNAAGKQEILTSGSRGRPLIGRIWSGQTRAEIADEYLHYVYGQGALEIEKKTGCVGVQLFRRIDGDIAEFTTISYWRSLEAMAAMHESSRDVRRVAHLEKDPEYLLELPEFVEITDVYANDWAPGREEPVKVPPRLRALTLAMRANTG
jgi:hypothetical protein